ncbi:hypothetical protein NERG_00933 [Nematocida ausubeli]|uniref:Uncharacterized protein n=1 Tax=Nematocida ausubeli (strain ATCC PRA-371 / ERTm2) TaxID=1913371 RepID=H8ZBI4_NEMA1|nr:hypothetical protein NERG_00933 [Nematocida ausubeli]
MEYTVEICLCAIICAVVLFIAYILVNSRTKRLQIVLDDLAQKEVIDVSIERANKELQKAALKGNWVIATVRNCEDLKEEDLVRILQSLGEMNIEELQLEGINKELKHEWISAIKTVRSISLHNAAISSAIISELGKVSHIESFKISGEASRWNRSKDEVVVNDTIRAISIKNTQRDILCKLFDQVHFQSLRSIVLNNTKIDSFKAFMNINMKEIRRLEVFHERLNYSDRLILQQFTNLETLTITQSEIRAHKYVESKDPEIFQFDRLWRLKLDIGIYQDLFQNGFLVTSQHNTHMLINHPEQNYSVEYLPIVNKTSSIFQRFKANNVLQIRIAGLQCSQKNSITAQGIDACPDMSMSFLKNLQIEHLLITFTTELQQNQAERILEAILQQSFGLYRLEKISVYFKFTCRLGRKQIESMTHCDRHHALKAIILSNIIITGNELPIEGKPFSGNIPANEAISLQMKYAAEHENSQTWRISTESSLISA